jgi:hypothetical protein
MTTCELLIQPGTNPLRVYCPHCGYESIIALPLPVFTVAQTIAAHEAAHTAFRAAKETP